MAKPPFPWIGSKEKIAPYILQLFPPKLTQYVEPFGGSGAVLLALPPDPNRLDIYNDLDAELVNLFSCIKECSNVLLRELKFLPIHGRKLFEYYRDFVAHKEVYFQNVQAEIECLGDRSCFTEEQAGELLPIFQERLALYDVKRAAAYYLAIRGSFSGTINSFGVKGLDVERFLKLFPPVSARLKDVPLENKNALQLIRERDKKGSLIYADPPYVKTERLYRVAGKLGRFRRFHVRLWQVLTGRDSYVVLSYNDCPFIRKLYQDWYISSFQRSNPLSQKKGSSFGELIITNYDPRPYMTSQMNLFDEPLGEWELKLVHIIDKVTFEKAQRILDERQRKFFDSHAGASLLQGKIKCGKCGSNFRKVVSGGIAYQVCRNHAQRKELCSVRQIPESAIYAAFLRLHYQLKYNGSSVLTQLISDLRAVRTGSLLWNENIVEINKQISDIASQERLLTQLKQQGSVDPDIFISRGNLLAERRRELKLQKERILRSEEDHTIQQTQDMLDVLESGPDRLDAFDEQLFSDLVEKIEVVDNEKLCFRLLNGLEVTEKIERTQR